MAAITSNYEEATTVATEFISIDWTQSSSTPFRSLILDADSLAAGLDNLPSEVQHILNEISHLEKKSQDVTKIRILQGEPALQGFSGSLSANVATQISENLRSALDGTSTLTDQITIALAPATAGTASSSQSNKKRKLTTQPSIKLTAPSPATTPSTAYSRSRPSRQVQANKATLEEPDDEDLDAEGEDDFEGEEGEEDPTLYCFCQKQSFGDMIGCDNAECPYQWFHISCVGVKTPLPDKWYCPECLKNKGAPERRKGRKK
ncbi:hypothetical protein H1R20_g2558, partial [Candolleomyces eurysporus]